jgi:hypothetical protein
MEKVFENEMKNFKYKNIIFREIFILNQYSNSFNNIIKKYFTTKSICGYVSIGISYYLNDTNFKKECTLEEMKNTLNEIKIENIMKYVKKAMEFIFIKRSLYIEDHKKLFIIDNNEDEKLKYLNGKILINNILNIN